MPLGGEIYGTTFYGGLGSGGVLFKIAQDGTDYTLLHHFGQDKHDGSNPRSGVIVGSNERLYGTTLNGGLFQDGTVFTCDTTGGNYALLHEFNGVDEQGSHPYGGLIALRDGVLVGTTSAGGAFGMGTIFTVDPEGFNFATIRHFRGPEGAFPQTELLLGPDDYLYGTAPGGGDLAGTLFRLKPDGIGFRVIHTFGDSDRDGRRPSGGLTLYRGRLYGTTSEGGPDGMGTVFSALFGASK